MNGFEYNQMEHLLCVRDFNDTHISGNAYVKFSNGTYQNEQGSETGLHPEDIDENFVKIYACGKEQLKQRVDEYLSQHPTLLTPKS